MIRPEWPLAAILAVGAALRTAQLGRACLWSDEVVTMRLALQPGPGALLGLLHRIDASRTPLHPILLQGWLGLFGGSEVAGRALSAAFGILTILLVYWLHFARSDSGYATILTSLSTSGRNLSNHGPGMLIR